MYSINSVPLMNPTRVEDSREGTSIQGGIIKTLTKVNAPLRGGYIPTPSTFTEMVIIFQMRVTRAGLEPLLALLGNANTLTRDADSTKYANVELFVGDPNVRHPWDSMFDVTVTLNAYDGVWRDTTAVTAGPTTIASSPQTITCLSNLSAPIQDQLIFVGGVFGQFVLTDSGGSWVKTNQAWAGTSTSGLLYNAGTGQAFKSTTADPFTPVSDASQFIQVSGNGGFSLKPSLASGDPTTRQVSLVLTTLTQSGVTFSIKAKRSYRMN